MSTVILTHMGRNDLEKEQCMALLHVLAATPHRLYMTAFMALKPLKQCELQQHLHDIPKKEFARALEQLMMDNVLVLQNGVLNPYYPRAVYDAKANALYSWQLELSNFPPQCQKCKNLRFPRGEADNGEDCDYCDGMVVQFVKKPTIDQIAMFRLKMEGGRGTTPVHKCATKIKKPSLVEVTHTMYPRAHRFKVDQHDPVKVKKASQNGIDVQLVCEDGVKFHICVAEFSDVHHNGELVAQWSRLDSAENMSSKSLLFTQARRAFPPDYQQPRRGDPNQYKVFQEAYMILHRRNVPCDGL